MHTEEMQLKQILKSCISPLAFYSSILSALLETTNSNHLGTCDKNYSDRPLQS